MTARIISGTQIASEILVELKKRVLRLQKVGKTPHLAVVLIGDDPASLSYVTSKERTAAQIGVRETTIKLSLDTTETKALKIVEDLNNDLDIDGIIVQTPLPMQIDDEKILNMISPHKDVDGWHPVNMGKLLRGEPCLLPCTPHGIQELLIRSGNSPSGKHVVICGRSNIVGKPLAAILLQKQPGANATVTVVHTGTPEIADFTRQADILIVALGSPQCIDADKVKQGAVVIDVGVNRIPDNTKDKGFRLVGDVDFDTVKEKASAITPVPGGVGPMTVTMLLQNTVESAEHKFGIS
ncbi:MAG: tetrahydrofolate dehydrogenase/cyclohydrolase catalytic domain-containing protein [Dehalococcoidia bacterium]|nr:tetrahydrofolate dehydrogenase/cyclohydrolase catalytic domain-containing protein [Dehalococcoidia bacterium]MDD5494967.1 tetrahydrofolate dehydrogenase/cyclohydrolase catalytic domain-containing protein [Dehalococcoidia bacterium]